MRSSPRRRDGFTLIEVTAVVLIMGVMAGLAGMSLLGALDQATLDDVAARIVAADTLTRQRAMRSGQPIYLHFITEQHELHCRQGEARSTPVAHWPAKYSVELIMLATDEGDIRINRSGRSGSYIVRVSDPSQRSRWIVVCGLTGERGVFADEQAVRDIQAIWAQKRLES